PQPERPRQSLGGAGTSPSAPRAALVSCPAALRVGLNRTAVGSGSSDRRVCHRGGHGRPASLVEERAQLRALGPAGPPPPPPPRAAKYGTRLPAAGPGGPPALLAPLERLGVLRHARLVLAVPVGQLRPVALRPPVAPPRVVGAHLPPAVRLLLRVGGDQLRRA